MAPESTELAASIEAARQIREATGENPWPPVNTWPVRLLDSTRLISIESIKIHNARAEAEAHEREG